MHRLYKALTAQPFFSNEGYREIPACPALHPYIRCFWGTEKPKLDQMQDHSTLVVPDTCMDLIFHANYTLNTFSASFCGIQDRAFLTVPSVHGHRIATFAIRFYPWAAQCFATDSLLLTGNTYSPGEQFFQPLIPPIMRRMQDEWDLQALISCAEELLLRHFHPNRTHLMLCGAIHAMLTCNCTPAIPSIAQQAGISTRQLERQFVQHIGLSPKTMQTLLRYQRVLEEALFSPSFDVQDAVLKYGYTDQSHLLHEFKKYHTMTPEQSRVYALAHH